METRRCGGIPLAMPRSSSSVSHQRRATSAHGQGDLRITVRASPPSASPRASHSSSTSHHLVFPDEGCTGGLLLLTNARGWIICSWGAQIDRRLPLSVTFFPEVTKFWRTPFSERNRPIASSVLTTLDSGAAQWYVEIRPVEHAIAMQLCPQSAAAWRGNPHLPSKACKFPSALMSMAYSAAGQAASALHAMALLQVHQARLYSLVPDSIH